MMVRNWMRAEPVTVTSATLVSEAKRILTENNLHAVPVVDDGVLRGLMTRANCLRAAHFVTRMQNPDELDFFVTRLAVKDIMVCNPATVNVSDTMEHCLRKGQELGVAQFPVLDGERVVGVISASEIFQLAAHVLGAWERRSGITLATADLGAGVIGAIARIAEQAGASVQAIYPLTATGPQAGAPHPRVIVRFHADDPAAVAETFASAGFTVLESVDARSGP